MHRQRTGLCVAGVLAVLTLAATSAWAAGFGSPGFKKPKYYHATGINLYPVAIADMNGDGRRDIVVGSEKNQTVSILYGKKGGGFSAPHNHPGGPYPFWISLADFNHDHHPDIAVASDSPAGEVVVLLSRRRGGYTSHSYPVGIDPYAMAVADFNRDGNPDLAVANDGSTFASILLGRHNGTFHSAISQPAGSNEVGIVAHDFNGDGKTDLAVLNSFGSNSQVTLLHGRGNGKFKEGGTFDAGATEPQGMTAGHFSGGKRLDLVVPDCLPSLNNDVYVLDAKKSGKFSKPHPFANDPGSCSYESAVGDLNGDGRPDLVTAIYTGAHAGDVSVMYGKGHGKLSAPHFFNATPGEQNYSIAIGRLNADKRPDLAVPDYDKPRVSVLQSK
jgi:FG-GAP-like repeat